MHRLRVAASAEQGILDAFFVFQGITDQIRLTLNYAFTGQYDLLIIGLRAQTRG